MVIKVFSLHPARVHVVNLHKLYHTTPGSGRKDQRHCQWPRSSSHNKWKLLHDSSQRCPEGMEGCHLWKEAKTFPLQLTETLTSTLSRPQLCLPFQISPRPEKIFHTTIFNCSQPLVLQIINTTTQSSSPSKRRTIPFFSNKQSEETLWHKDQHSMTKTSNREQQLSCSNGYLQPKGWALVPHLSSLHCPSRVPTTLPAQACPCTPASGQAPSKTTLTQNESHQEQGAASCRSSFQAAPLVRSSRLPV